MIGTWTSLVLTALCLQLRYSGASGPYVDEVDNFFNKYLTGINTCKVSALNKAVNVPMEPNTAEKRSAVAMINLYTKECSSYANETNQDDFTTVLNRMLHQHGGNISNLPSGMWADATNLLIRGLNKFSNSTHSEVFRGCYCDKTMNAGDTFSFVSFASTSTDVKVAHDFLPSDGSGSLFVLNGMYNKGTYIKEYSAFPDKYDVLLQPNFMFEIKRVDDPGLLNYFYDDASKEVKNVVMLRPAGETRAEGNIKTCDCSHRTVSSGIRVQISLLFVMFSIFCARI